jgi:hypothetical protein
VFPGSGNYIPQDTAAWSTNCAPYLAVYAGCAGQYGYLYIQDYGSNGNATSMNHAFFVQDAWTIRHGVTINAGIRLEHEYLPAEDQPSGAVGKPIQFGWGDKIAPRLGAAWDVRNNGKWKVFGSYGKFYDVMKLNLAISSFGGQYWNNCYYALNTQNLTSIAPVFDSSYRYCQGSDDTAPANFGSAGPPAGITFIQNVNFRAWPTTCSTCSATEEGVEPGIKPYQQHETVFGIDHQFARNVAFEARWDRRRLDRLIEDSALYNPAVGETFVIGNPGYGPNKSFDGFWNFLYGSPSGCGTAGNTPCPPNTVKGARSYDGVEFRLTKATSDHWAGMFSYTYSHFRGNYSGLTNTDISDGGGGRNSPNNSRAFDEPYMSWTANGTPDSGPLATDRPSTFKAYGYYELPWMHNKLTSDFGLFQYLYQGSPVSTFMDVGLSSPNPLFFGAPSAEGGAFNQYVEGWGKWVNVSQDPATGAITTGAPYARRTPWFTQSDFQFQQGYKITENKTVTFSATVPNLLNQRAVTAYWESLDSTFYPQWIGPSSSYCGGPCNLLNGAAFYDAVETPYNWQSLLNSPQGTPSNQLLVNSNYGKPLYHQTSRNLYMSIKFTF